MLDKQADVTEALRVHGSPLPTGGDVLFGQEFQEVLLKEVRPVGGMAQLLRLKQQRSRRDRRDNKGSNPAPKQQHHGSSGGHRGSSKGGSKINCCMSYDRMVYSPKKLLFIVRQSVIAQIYSHALIRS